MADAGPRLDPMELHLEGVGRRKDIGRLGGTVLAALRLTWAASRSGFCAAAITQIVTALSLAGLVLVGKYALTTLFSNQVGTTEVVVVVVLLSLLTAVASGTAGLQKQQERLLGEQVSALTWLNVLDVTGRVELEYFESPKFYDQLERVQTNAVIRPSIVTSSVFGLVGSGVGIVGLLGVLLSIDPLLVPVLLLAGIPTLLLGRRVSSLEFRFIKATASAVRAREYLRGVLTEREEAKEVRAFTMESALRRRHDERSADLVTQVRRHVRVRQRYVIASVLTTATALAVSLGLVVWFVSLGRIGLPEAIAAALGVRLLSSRLDALFQSVSGLLESSVFLEDLRRFEALAVIRTGPPETGTGPSLHREIAVRDVTYTYPGSSTPALADIDLTIGANEVVAIVGESGSGKTTLAKILAGLYAPVGGTVQWDGVDVTGMAPRDLRRSVSVIFQDFVRYQLSAQENIGLGDSARVDDRDAVRGVAERARAAPFLERLSQGYDTILSREYAGGTDLSVGQWQRVALARALYRDAPLVILDEPSASLDPRAEDALFSDVRVILEGRAAVLISHRYSTVRSADRILVMQDGRIIEDGCHDTLMARAGTYAEMFSIQAKAYL